MQKCTEELADLAVKQGLFFALDWPVGSQIKAEHTGNNYIPSDALGQLGEEIKALRSLAAKSNFTLPYAAPSYAGVVLPAIPTEWTNEQPAFSGLGIEKARFDQMTRRLCDASTLVCNVQDKGAAATTLEGDAGQQTSAEKLDESSSRTSPPVKKLIAENKLLHSLAKSKLALRVPSADGGMIRIDAPPLLTLTQPLATPKVCQVITISGVVTSITPELHTVVIADKFFVRGYVALGAEVGHILTLRVRTTFESLKMDIVDWQPAEASDGDQ